MNRPGWSHVAGAAIASAVATWVLALALLDGADAPRVDDGTASPESGAPLQRTGASRDAAARIAALESEVATLRSARAARPRAAPPSDESPPAGSSGPSPRSPTVSLPTLRSKVLPLIGGWGAPAGGTKVSAADARLAAERAAAAIRAGDDASLWIPLALAGPADRPETLAPLLGVVRAADVDAGARAAVLDALAVAGRDVGATAEEILASSTDPALRSAALRAIHAGARGPGDVPAVVRSLLTDPSAPESERDLALTIVASRDPAAAIAPLERLVLSEDAAERGRGLNVLVTLRDAAWLPLLRRVAQRDDVGDSVEALTTAIAETKDRKWSALQMTGEPDTPRRGDYGTAWAAQSEQMGLVTVDLTFPRSVRPEAIRIRETLAPGGVASVEVESGGTWDVVWEGRADPGEPPRWFEPAIARSAATTNRVRIVIDTDRVPGWEEIDAVELVGDGVRQWASAATATSTYGQ